MWGFVLIIVMILTMLPIHSVMVQAEVGGRSAEALPEDDVVKISILKSDKVTEVKHEDKLSFDDNLWVRFDLIDITEENYSSLQGKKYCVNIPAYLKISDFDAITVKDVGTVSVEAGTVYLQFQDVIDVSEGTITAAHFEFGAKLDENQVDGRQSIEIPLKGDTKLKADVSENAIKDAEIKSKSGSYNTTDGTIEWTVTLNKEIAQYVEGSGLQYTEDYVFKDDLGSNQNYVDGSFMLNAVSQTPTYESGQLLYLIPKVNTETTITYKTKPVDSILLNESRTQLNDLSDVTISNHAKLYKPDGTTLINEKIADVNMNGEKWLTKVGKSYDLEYKTVTWELVINTNGYKFDEIKVYDQLDDYLEYDKNIAAIDVKAEGSSSYTSRTDNENFTGKEVGQAAKNNLLTFTNVQGKFTVTYKTKLKDTIDFDKQNASIETKNKAWLTYIWKPNGIEPGYTDIGIPTVEKPYSIETRMVEKSGIYDPKTAKIKWTVTLNKNRQNLTKAEVTDVIRTQNADGTGQQEILPADGSNGMGDPKIVSVNGISGAGDYTIAISNPHNNEDNTISYDVDLLKSGSKDWGTDMVTYEYYTVATDSAFYANNAKEKFTNSVELQADRITPIKVTASPSFESKVLEKEAVGYDYRTHFVTWKVTVNKNQYNKYTNVSFEDTLPIYLSYVGGSFTVDGSTQNPNITTSAGCEKLAYELRDVDTTKVITFQTKLDVNAKPEGFDFVKDNSASDSTKKLTIENTAKLTKTEGPDVRSQDSITIANTAFDKSSSIDENKYTATYTIKINQAGADISALATDGKYIVLDTMGNNMIIDEESVKLYKANVSVDGNFSEGSEVPGVKLKINGQNISMELPIGDSIEARTRPYILQYKVLLNINEIGDFSLVNNASFGGQSTGVVNGDTVNFHSAWADGGSTRIPNRKTLTLRMRSTTDPSMVIRGARYGLYRVLSDGEPQLIQSSVTDENGVIRFDCVQTVSEGNPITYTIRQLEAPAGYLLDTAAYVIQTTATSSTDYDLQVQAVEDTGSGTGPIAGGGTNEGNSSGIDGGLDSNSGEDLESEGSNNHVDGEITSQLPANNDDNSKKINSVTDTGDHTPVGRFVCILFAGMVLVVFALRRKDKHC